MAFTEANRLGTDLFSSVQIARRHQREGATDGAAKRKRKRNRGGNGEQREKRKEARERRGEDNQRRTGEAAAAAARYSQSTGARGSSQKRRAQRSAAQPQLRRLDQKSKTDLNVCSACTSSSLPLRNMAALNE